MPGEFYVAVGLWAVANLAGAALAILFWCRGFEQPTPGRATFWVSLSLMCLASCYVSIGRLVEVLNAR